MEAEKAHYNDAGSVVNRRLPGQPWSLDWVIVFNVLLFLKAILAGFAIAVPIGAIGAMCLRRGLQGRWIISLVTGFGAAIADMVLAAAAMFGLSLVTRYLNENEMWLKLIGGLVLLYIGGRMIYRRKISVSEAPRPQLLELRHWRIWLRAFSTGFGLTIINPATFLAFIGLFAGLGLLPNQPNGLLAHWVVITGVFTGSMLWWCVLTATAFAARHKLPLSILTGINVVLGALVAGLGAYGVISYLDHLDLTW